MEKADGTAHPSRTESHLPGHSPPASQSGRRVGQPCWASPLVFGLTESTILYIIKFQILGRALWYCHTNGSILLVKYALLPSQNVHRNICICELLRMHATLKIDLGQLIKRIQKDDVERKIDLYKGLYQTIHAHTDKQHTCTFVNYVHFTVYIYEPAALALYYPGAQDSL
jgi:hypothetical protein